MTKTPEEGEIWEWRAFGRPSKTALKKIRARPIRLGVKDRPGEDIYLVTPVSDQNVKLRSWGGQWVLKLKLLLTTAAQGIELYSETAGWVYRFPVGPELLGQAAQLLGAILSEPYSRANLTADEFIQALATASPPAVPIRVAKVRSQFEFDGGWVELADVTFPSHHTQSLSIHSTQREVVEVILDDLDPGEEMDVMNYVEACKRWE